MRKDTERALAAAKAIVDNRNIETDKNDIAVTLEHAISTILIAIYKDPRLATGILNEALVPGIEQRLAFYANKPR